MKNKLFGIFLAIGFLALVPSAKAATGPLSFVGSIIRAGENAVHSPLEFVEEYFAKPVIAAEQFVDNQLGKPDQQAQLKRAAKKAAKKAAKAKK